MATNPSYEQSKQVAEAGRETDWKPPSFGKELIEGMKRVGAFGMKIPVEYGGLGLTHRAAQKTLEGRYIWLEEGLLDPADAPSALSLMTQPEKELARA